MHFASKSAGKLYQCKVKWFRGNKVLAHWYNHRGLRTQIAISYVVTDLMDFQNNSYVPPGTLPKPGWLGRGIRLGLGVLVLLGAFGIVESFYQLIYTHRVPESIGLWVFAGLLFLSMQHVIDLGLRVQWGRKAQIAILILAGICIGIDIIFYARLWAPPLGLLFCIWGLLIAIPLGLALILAAILGTPGCEMRSYADLLARLKGHSAIEHYCPGGIDFIDRGRAHLGKK